jgi:hypothetical protein
MPLPSIARASGGRSCNPAQFAQCLFLPLYRDRPYVATYLRAGPAITLPVPGKAVRYAEHAARCSNREASRPLAISSLRELAGAKKECHRNEPRLPAGALRLERRRWRGPHARLMPERCGDYARSRHRSVQAVPLVRRYVRHRSISVGTPLASCPRQETRQAVEDAHLPWRHTERAGGDLRHHRFETPPDRSQADIDRPLCRPPRGRAAPSPSQPTSARQRSMA